MSFEIRVSDLRVLRWLLDEDSGLNPDFIPDAFEDMLIRLEEHKQEMLTPKQRKWVNEKAELAGIEPSAGPVEDEGPDPVRFTSGAVPRGKEVTVNVGALPLKPPGRR